MRKLIFLLAFLPACASAYDDIESQKAYVTCLVKEQRVRHFSPEEDQGAGLSMACQSEGNDLMRYNCSMESTECQSLPVFMAYKVEQRIQ